MDTNNGKRILITGAAGSLGRQLIYELTRCGCRPVAHVRESSDTTYIDSLGLEKRIADLRDDGQIGSLVAGIDGIIHTAAWIDFRQDRLTQFTGINAIAPVKLFQAAEKAGVQRFVHVSSVAATAAIPRQNGGDQRPGGAPVKVNEDTPFNLGHLRIPYIMTKRAAEEELVKIGAGSRTDLIIVNPSIMVAPSDTGDDRARALERIPRFVLPGFNNRLNLVDLRDVAPAVIAALARGRRNERYILAGDNITARELVINVTQAIGRASHVMRVPRRLIEIAAVGAVTLAKLTGRGKVAFYPDLVKLLDYDWVYSSLKARKELGYTYRSIWVTLDELLNNRFNGTYLKPAPLPKQEPVEKPA